MPFALLSLMLALSDGGAPARLIPPPPPADLAALASMDPATDNAVARRMLSENGLPPEKRRKAAEALAAGAKTSVVVAVLDALAACGGTCGATRDLADLLVSMPDAVAADPVALDRVAKAARAPEDPAHMAARRVLAAMPAERRPDGFKDEAVRTVTLKTVPGAMQYDIKEVKVKPGELIEFSLENTDTLQHNLLVVAPGKMSEVGVAADKMGETAAGKACHFVPDMPSVLAVMGLVDPGKSGRLFFEVPQKPGTYAFVCTYPGHWRMMNGKLKVAP